MKIDHKSGLTLYLGYQLVYKSEIGTSQKLTLHAKRPFISGPYKWARVYLHYGYHWSRSSLRVHKISLSYIDL